MYVSAETSNFLRLECFLNRDKVADTLDLVC